MNPILRDMLDHQFWADAVLWNAIGALEAARGDVAIRGRLHHIHMVQRAFIWGIRGGSGQFNVTRAEDFPAFDDLRAYACGSHDEIRGWLGAALDEEFERSIVIPWFRNPPLTLTITEALTQCAMHSHHHRGQNATRLRELGGEPPSTDLIMWYWKEKPPPLW